MSNHNIVLADYNLSISTNNWYTRSLSTSSIPLITADTERLEKEAALKEKMISGLLSAILMVMSGSSIQNAAKKMNVKEQQIEEAMKNKQNMEAMNKMFENMKNIEPMYFEPEPLQPLQPLRYNKKVDDMKKDKSIPQIQQIPQSPKSPQNQQNNSVSIEELMEFIKSNEGYSRIAYLDPNKKDWAVGVGFNLSRNDARTLLKNVGANYDLVLRRKQALTDKQINELLKYDVIKAMEDASKFTPNFDSLPKNAKIVLIDMTYNMGAGGLSKFKDLRNAIANNDFEAAAQEMRDSNWFNQVKGRGKKLVSLIEELV